MFSHHGRCLCLASCYLFSFCPLGGYLSLNSPGPILPRQPAQHLIGSTWSMMASYLFMTSTTTMPCSNKSLFRYKASVVSASQPVWVCSMSAIVAQPTAVEDTAV